MVSRTSTVPNNENPAGEVLLDDYVAELQGKEQFYYSQLATMKQQILSINQDYMQKEAELSAQLREAVNSKQVLQAELEILSDSHQRLLRGNAECEDRVSCLTSQIAELTARCDFLEAERIQALTSFELPHPQILKSVIEAICEKEVAVAEKEAATKDLDIANDKLECAVVLINQLETELEVVKREILKAAETEEAKTIKNREESESIENQFRLKNAEIEKLAAEIEEGRKIRESFESREKELLENVHEIELQLAAAQDEMKTHAAAMDAEKSRGTAQASEMINSLRTEISQLRIEQKTTNERLQQALEDANAAEEKFRFENPSDLKTPTKRKSVKGTDSVETRKLQMEVTSLRLKLAEMHEMKENANKRKLLAEDDQCKNRRVSLDQEECRQQ